jgi:hypothetical protein
MKRKDKIARYRARGIARQARQMDQGFNLCPTLTEIKKTIKRGDATRKEWGVSRYFVA